MNKLELRLKDLMEELINDDEQISLWLDGKPAVSGKCWRLRSTLNSNILNTSVIGISSLPDALLIRADIYEVLE